MALFMQVAVVIEPVSPTGMTMKSNGAALGRGVSLGLALSDKLVQPCKAADISFPTREQRTAVMGWKALRGVSADRRRYTNRS